MLKAAGKNLTRAGVMKQDAGAERRVQPVPVPGITIKTGGAEQFPIEQTQLQRWANGGWKSFGGLWGFRAG